MIGHLVGGDGVAEAYIPLNLLPASRSLAILREALRRMGEQDEGDDA